MWMPYWPDWVLDAQIFYGHEGTSFYNEGWWDNPGRGIVHWYMAGAGQGGQGGSCGPPGMLRKGGRGGQGGQWLQGSAPWSDFGKREWVSAGRAVMKARPFNPYTFHMFGPSGWDDMMHGETRGYGQPGWSIDQIDTPPDPRYFVSDDPPPGPPSKFGKMTALGGGMGFTSTPTDCGSGGNGGDLTSGAEGDAEGDPGIEPAGSPWPPAKGGVFLEPTFPPPQDRGGQGAHSWQDPRTPGWLWYGDNSYVWHAGGGGGGGAANWQYYLGHVPATQAGSGGSGAHSWGGGGGGGGAGENNRAQYGGDGGYAGCGCVAIITTAADTPRNYLRMLQRNDTVGVERHPRLGGTGSNNPTSQLGKPKRLTGSNTYF